MVELCTEVRSSVVVVVTTLALTLTFPSARARGLRLSLPFDFTFLLFFFSPFRFVFWGFAGGEALHYCTLAALLNLFRHHGRCPAAAKETRSHRSR